MRRKRLTLVIVPIIVLVLAFSVIWLQGASALMGTSITFTKVKANPQDYSSRFIVYATSGCSRCDKQVKILEGLCGEDTVVFYDIVENKSSKYYRRILELLVEGDVIDSSDPIRGRIPLTALFKEDSLTSIIFGTMSEEDWRSIIEAEHDTVSVYLGENVPEKAIDDSSLIRSLSDSFLQEGPLNSGSESLLVLLPLISLTAAIDAVNPCELNAFLLLVVYVFYHVGRKSVLKVGLAFTAAIFISYYLMGLGLLRILQGIPQLRLIIAAFGLIVGFWEATSFLETRRKHVPDVFKVRIEETLKRAINPYTAFIAGVAVSLLLLPCTSGPYFIAIDLLAKRATVVDGLILMTVYNGIIVSPFLAVVFVVYSLNLGTFKMRRWVEQRERWLRLLGGITMISISLLLIIIG